MTAIYAFSCPEKRRAAVATDNIEFNSQAIVDKVGTVFDRYVVAVHGSDIMAEVIGKVASFFHVEGHVTPDSIEIFVDQLAPAGHELASILFPKYKEAYESGQIPENAWNSIHEQDASIVVLDCNTFRLCDVSFGLPFPPDAFAVAPIIQDLPPGKLHRFALAAQAVPGPPLPIKTAALSDTAQYFSELLEADRKKERALGDLGAMVVVDGKSRVEKSCFKNAVHRIRESFKDRLIGYRIVVAASLGPEGNTADKSLNNRKK